VRPLPSAQRPYAPPLSSARQILKPTPCTLHPAHPAPRIPKLFTLY